jgi:two-component system chemotaxis sensor kinase CheA
MGTKPVDVGGQVAAAVIDASTAGASEENPAISTPTPTHDQLPTVDSPNPFASWESTETAPDNSWGIWIVPKTYRLVYKPSPEFLERGSDPTLFITHLVGSVDVRSMTADPPGVPVAEKTWMIEFVTDWEIDKIRGIFRSIGEDGDLRIEEVASDQSDEVSPSTAQEVDTPNLVPAEGLVVSVPPSPLSSGDGDTEPHPDVQPILPASIFPRSGPASSVKPVGTTKSGVDIQTLRVSTDKIDKLINLVGELVINQAILNDVIRDFTIDDFPRLVEAVSDMEHASRDLQERVMAVRMLPIKHAFGRFPRLVRDIASSVGKQVELKTFGEETELDKTVIEAIADPLTHLVRNSIDHGLETAEERRALGKPDVGVVSLDAIQEGGSIIVNVSDDGRGLNKSKIFQKAVDRGLIGPDDALTDEQVYDLIFEPGFSTADQVTNLSGRGVGMDIVKSTINGLGGMVTVSSRPGAGATFRIRLPLTVAILEGLSVSVGDEVYVFPLTSVLENIRPRRKHVSIVASGSEVVQIRGEILPLLRLHRVFNAKPRETRPDRALVVVVENEGRKVAIMVDELITQSQIVIKSLEMNYRKVDGIAGATILGDGRVALILDVPWLVRCTRTRPVGMIEVDLEQQRDEDNRLELLAGLTETEEVSIDGPLN